MYTIKVNGKFDYQVSAEQGKTLVDGNPVDLDIQAVAQNKFHVLYQRKSYNVELIESDPQLKTQTIKVNGTLYQLGLTDQFDTLLKQLGMDAALVAKVQEIKAPMPGLVLKIVAAEGDEVKKGDSLIVLEAMKMENMIKSPADGRIKNIPVKQGDKIEKNTVLVQFH
jgi:biotin carboxyl carrier protein